MKKYAVILFIISIFTVNTFSQNIEKDEKKALKCLDQKLSNVEQNSFFLLELINQYNKAIIDRDPIIQDTKDKEIILLLNEAGIFNDDLLDIDFLLSCISQNKFDTIADENGYIIIYELVSFFEELIRRPEFRYEISPFIWKESIDDLFHNKKETSDYNKTMYHILQTGFRIQNYSQIEYTKKEKTNTVSIGQETFIDFEIEDDDVVEEVAEEKLIKNKTEKDYYTVVEKMPISSLKGSEFDAYFVEESREKGLVIVRFIVNKQGQVEQFGLIRSSGNKLLDAKAIALIKTMPKWTPGEQRGIKVNVQFIKAVIFE